jgi:hypothetical protein
MITVMPARSFGLRARVMVVIHRVGRIRVFFATEAFFVHKRIVINAHDSWFDVPNLNCNCNPPTTMNKTGSATQLRSPCNSLVTLIRPCPSSTLQFYLYGIRVLPQANIGWEFAKVTTLSIIKV